jgi:glutamate-5-semialdehyde dehydrogenase
VCAIVRSEAARLVPVFLDSLDAAAAIRGASARLHVVEGSESHVPAERFRSVVEIARPGGVTTEPAASTIEEATLAEEWEWENAPEVSLVVVDSIEESVSLCNRYSPHFVASLVSDDPEAQSWFAAPFVGNGFTRWVDGQYALNAPELGLSNWQYGRTLGRGAILSGDSVHTIRYRATVADHTVKR